MDGVKLKKYIDVDWVGSTANKNNTHGFVSNWDQDQFLGSAGSISQLH